VAARPDTGPDPRCPTCGAAGAAIARRERDRAWTCFACAACGLQYWSPRAIDPAFYADAHHDTYERRRRGEAFLRERHHVFLRRARPGRLLDLGCGEGMFLQVARERGFEIAGLDLDPGNVAAARARGLAPIEQGLVVDGEGRLAPMLVGAAPFDWVTAFEVLEHQPDPLGFLRAARGLLGPAGRLCGSVPNRERILAARERRRSDGDFPPHHFLWFSRGALEATLRAAGFARVLVEPIAERDPQAFAAYLENALLGGLTGAAKGAVRRALERTSGEPAGEDGRGKNEQGGDGKRRRGGSRRTLVQAARRLKNAPFVPAALALSRILPERARALYFEAG
jgi:SAM-dependent methyltransferase